METLNTPFLPCLPSLEHHGLRRHHSKHPRVSNTPFLPSLPSLEHSRRPAFVLARQTSDRWSLSDGNSSRTRKPPPVPYVHKPRKKPLSDDNARRIIKSRAQYLSQLRRNQGPQALTPRWIWRTPEQMEQYIKDDRDGHLYGKHVVAAIRTVRGLAQKKEGEYSMREVMSGFVAKLTFRDMCVVLKEQRSWRQARDFFGWMKLQLCYRPSVIVYTILLRIYGQVGKIKLAEQTFLEMLEAGIEPDEVACGTLLCAYARWGRHKDMMTFYGAVRSRQVLPSASVYNFMISSLQQAKLHNEVIWLWKQMLDAGAEPDQFTYTVVINSYIKEGLHVEASETFERMKESKFKPEEVSYSLLINSYVKGGKFSDALQLFEDMKSRGIVPSHYTCATLLTVYYKTGEYGKAISLFSEMERHCIMPDEVIYGLLIRIYGKLKLVEDAEKTFEDARKLGLLEDEKTYMAMVQVYLDSGNTTEALEVFNLMNSRNVKRSKFSQCALLRCYIAKEDVHSAELTFQTLSETGNLDVVSCNEMLVLYMKLNLLDKAKTLVSQIRNSELQLDENIYRTIMQVYCKNGMLMEAEQLLEKMKNHGINLDKHTKTSLMALYGEAGGIQRAERLFKTLNEPDATALSVMLYLFIESGKHVSESKEVTRLLLKLPDGLSLASQLVTRFAKKGNTAGAIVLFDEIIKLGFIPQQSSIADLINMCGQYGQLQQAEHVFAAVLDFLEVGGQVYHSMLVAYLKNNKIDDANLLYKQLVSQGLPLDAHTFSKVVHALTNHGKYEEAENVIYDSFEGGAELDTVAYNTCIKSMLEAGKLYLASEIYHRMISLGVPRSLRTYHTMISVYGRGGKLDKAIEIFNDAQNSGISIDEKTYTNMINYYGKAGKHIEASLLFNKMLDDGMQPGKISYNVMINAYATAGLYTEAVGLLESMKRDSLSPDSATYLALVRAYVESDKYDKAEETIHTMRTIGISPTCAHYNQVISAYVKTGCIADSERIFQDMQQSSISPDLATYRIMFRAYIDYGFVDRGISLFEHMDWAAKPDGFILSAAIHLYEFAGRKSDAMDILDFLNYNGLVFIQHLKIGSKAKPKHESDI